jgi:hypothetical protein
VDADDPNKNYLLWETCTVAVHCKKMSALDSRTIYVAGRDWQVAGATSVGANSEANGNSLVRITCARMTALTQTNESAFFIIPPSKLTLPNWQSSKGPAPRPGPIARARTTKNSKSVICLLQSSDGRQMRSVKNG